MSQLPHGQQCMLLEAGSRPERERERAIERARARRGPCGDGLHKSFTVFCFNEEFRPRLLQLVMYHPEHGKGRGRVLGDLWVAKQGLKCPKLGPILGSHITYTAEVAYTSNLPQKDIGNCLGLHITHEPASSLPCLQDKFLALQGWLQQALLPPAL